MPPQNVGTSMNLQIVLNTPKKSVLESSHTEKIFAKLFYKKKKKPLIIPISWNPENSPDDYFINY